MSIHRVLALLACVLVATADIDLSGKNVIYGDGIDRHVNIEAVTKTLPTYNLSRTIQVNSRCFSGSACGSAADTQSSFEQTFEDGLQLPICLCSGFVMGAAEVARKFAHVPAALRSSVNLLASKAQGDGAYSINNAISFLGQYSANVFVSEAAHNFDTANQVTNGKDFLNALAKDSCVVDGASQLSEDDAWASTVLLWTYFVQTNVTNATALTCWANQKKVVESLLPVETIPASYFETVYEIIPLTSKTSALGVGKDNTSITTASATARQWNFLRASGKTFLICDTVAHLCIDAYGRQGNGEEPILFNRRNAGANQRWTVAISNGLTTFANQANGLFLDISSCSKFSNSTNAVMAVESLGQCQKWILRAIPKPTPPTHSSTVTHSSTISHSESYTQSVSPTESFSAPDTTRTKSHTASISTPQVDVISTVEKHNGTHTAKQTVSVSYRPTSGNNATKSESATHTSIETESYTRVATSSRTNPNKTKTATVSRPDPTYTTASHSHSGSKTFGSSVSVSKTRSEGPAPTTTSTISHSESFTTVERPTHSITERDATRSQSQSVSHTSRGIESVSKSETYTPPSRTLRRTETASYKPTNMNHTMSEVVTKSSVDYNATRSQTRFATSTQLSNRTRTVSESAPEPTHTAASHSHTASQGLSTYTTVRTKSEGPTRSSSVSSTHSVPTGPSTSTHPSTSSTHSATSSTHSSTTVRPTVRPTISSSATHTFPHNITATKH